MRKRFSKWLMLPLAGNEPFQRFAIALGNSVLSKRCKGRVYAHREIHDVVTNDHGIQMSISVEILVRYRFTFDLVKTFNRRTLMFPTMSSLNSPSLSLSSQLLLFSLFSSIFPGQWRLIAPSSWNPKVSISILQSNSLHHPHLSTVKEFVNIEKIKGIILFIVRETNDLCYA